MHLEMPSDLGKNTASPLVNIYIMVSEGLSENYSMEVFIQIPGTYMMTSSGHSV